MRPVVSTARYVYSFDVNNLITFHFFFNLFYLNILMLRSVFVFIMRATVGKNELGITIIDRNQIKMNEWKRKIEYKGTQTTSCKIKIV